MTEILRCVSDRDIHFTALCSKLSLNHICALTPPLPPPQIYTYEMKIIKVVPGDAGGYRCEVTSKDKCDSSTFEISVEGDAKWTVAP